MVTIYALCEPGTHIVRYVGKAIDLPSRIRCHGAEVRNPKFRTRKVNWLRSLKGAAPVVKVLCLVSEESWSDAERFWIAEMRDRGCDLTNYANGGQTSPVEGKGHTEATKAILRAKAIASGRRPPSQKGTVASEHTRRKLSDASKRRGAVPPPMGGWNKGVRQTHCSRGHEFTDENTYFHCRKDDGRATRHCRACMHYREQRRKSHLKGA